MLVNGRALLSLINSKSYDKRLAEKLRLLQDERWRDIYAILTANLLFIFEDENHLSSPIVMIIIEDCTVEPADDNQTGMPFSFVLKSKTTKRVFTFSADSFKSLQQWIHYLTVCSLDYIQAMLSSNSSDQSRVEEAKTPESRVEDDKGVQPKVEDNKPVQSKTKTEKTKAKNKPKTSTNSNHKT